VCVVANVNFFSSNVDIVTAVIITVTLVNTARRYILRNAALRNNWSGLERC
jgi:hypothetical protein